MVYVAKLAKAHANPAKIGRWLMFAVALGVISFVIRIFEFKGLNTRWDSNAYGSVVWALLGMHVAHILAGTLENFVLALKLFVGPVEEKHYVDCTLNAVYWYFITGSWLVIFAVVFVAVRFI
jgi:heme/copper-type cytochrome/quinol oxidase subunit 3